MIQNKNEILTIVEQCLCCTGVLEPCQCRARGAVKQSLIANLINGLLTLGEIFDNALKKILTEKNGTVQYDKDTFKDIIEEFYADLEKQLLKSVDDAIKQGLSDASNDLGIEIKFSSIDKGIIDILRQQEIVLSEKTVAKISGNVQLTLLESQRLGENLEQAIKRLQTMSTLSHYEAERIARTELARAANAARLQGYRGRIEIVKWNLGPAYKGGCVCGDNAGEHTIDEALGMAMPAHPNCDCYWSPVIK